MPLKPEQVKSVADAKKIVEERGITHVKVGVFDGDAILRGKYMSKAKFFSALEGGFGFCDVVLGWDSNDQLFDNVKYTGWHTAYPDAWVRVIPETCREIPFEDNTLFFLCEFVNKAEEICPRGVLRRVLDRAAKMGYEAYSAAEYEFFMFDETPESVREKGYPQPDADDARLFRLFDAARLGLGRALSRDPRHLRKDAHADRGPAHRDRPRRSRSGPRRRQGAGERRPRRLVQDLHEGAGAAPRPDGDLHGQVVEQLAGPERPHPCQPEGQGRQVGLPRRQEAAQHERPAALVRRRPAGADAGAAVAW